MQAGKQSKFLGLPFDSVILEVKLFGILAGFFFALISLDNYYSCEHTT